MKVKFYEAVLNESMNPGDVFETSKNQTFKNNIVAMEGVDSTWYVWENSNNKEVLFIKAVMELEGIIKRAEPVVLSAEDIARKVASEFDNASDYGTKCANEGIRCGRLEEWQRKEQIELREAVQEYVENEDVLSYDRIEEALQNLKPPYERDYETRR